jgi:hypothetical protein
MGVENLVKLYVPGDWLRFCLGPKAKNTHLGKLC